jgi:hypothetical protein
LPGTAQAAQHLEAVDPGKANVEDDHVEPLLAGSQHGLLALGNDIHGMALAFEDAGNARGQGGVVLYDQDAHRVNHTAVFLKDFSTK